MPLDPHLTPKVKNTLEKNLEYRRSYPVTGQYLFSSYICTGFPAPKPLLCAEALGMQNEKIPDSAITASSEYSSAYKAINGRLHFLHRSGRVGSWSARTNDVYQYLQVNFGDWTKISRVATQGRTDGDQWVKSFTLSYGYDSIFFRVYKEDDEKKVKIRFTIHKRHTKKLMLLSLHSLSYTNSLILALALSIKMLSFYLAGISSK